MYFVYILQSEVNERFYYGFTSRDPQSRFLEHNKNTANGYTKKYQPWKLVWYAGFISREKAEAFEKYLKGGSGYAFSRRHLLSKS